MRKNYIAFAVLAMAALLVSCQNREFVEDDIYVPQKGEIVFRLANNSKETKSSSAVTRRGETIDLGVIDGTNFFLEETITDLNNMAYAPETKGTPAFTENFTALYGDFKAAAYKSTTPEDGTASYGSAAFDDGVFEKLDDKEMWKRKFENLDESLPLYFFLRAPYAQEGTTVKNLKYDTSDGSISFEYDGTSLTTAAAQKDLLFTSREVTADEYADFINEQKGIPVLFHHALTGVKFAIGNTADDIVANKIAITSVVFKGLYDSGDCIVTPREETDGYVDDPTDDYSSGDGTTVKWSSKDASDYSKSTGYSSGEFAQTAAGNSAPVSYANGGHFGTNENNKYPNTFVSGGGKLQNLNDASATQTFWFIPQTLSRAKSETPVTLTINYKFGGAECDPMVLDLSDILSTVTWKAGEIRTYTIKIDEVNVKIEDTVTPGTGTTSKIVGSKKDAVTITNTGNTDVFIRAAIVGQWLDSQDRPVFGFTDNVNQLYQVESWYEDQFVNHTGDHGVFVNLAGYSNKAKNTSYANPYPASTGARWFYNADDGYYYFSEPVAPAGTTSVPLFSSYTISKIPPATNAGVELEVEMYFVLEVATQAISARNSDGTLQTDFLQAWKDALAIDEPEDGSGTTTP